MHFPFNLILTASFVVATAFGVEAAGYRNISKGDLEFGVWYPTDAVPGIQRLGPFDAVFARNARPKGENLEAILLSHGIGGKHGNLHLTAQTLADAGYVVVAPDHRADRLVGGPDTSDALAHRVGELERALELLRRHPDFRGRIADGPVHGLGYSLGSMTVALAAGAGFDTTIVRSHCAENGENDRQFCFRSGETRDRSDRFVPNPLIDGNLILVAPATQGLWTKEGGVDARKIWIFAIAGDAVVPPRFHGEPFRDLVSRQTKTVYREFTGHHRAFIAPFPKRVTDKEDIPVAGDPAGFDRSAFLADVNKAILAVFRSENR